MSDGNASHEPPMPSRRISYAQNMEDILLDRLFHDRVGTFFDIGAGHPVADNNTYFFYLRGWRGVNIEPLSLNYERLQHRRPEDRNLAVAVSSAEGELPFYEVVDSEGLSTLSEEIAREHRARGYTVTEGRVPVRTVASLVEQYGLEPPDFLSLDVEGHEHQVLLGIPLSTWRPRVLVIESTLPNTTIPSHESWEPYLLESGYQFAAFNGLNRFYLREDLADQRERLSVPVNVLDGYERYEVALHRERADALQKRLDEEAARHAHDLEFHEKLRVAWDWDRVQAEQAQAAWEHDRAAIARERAAWVEQRERQQAEWDRQRAAHRRDWTQTQAQLTQTQAQLVQTQAQLTQTHLELTHTQVQLRPYRLLDRLGLVTAGHGWARRLKHGLGGHLS